MAYIGSIPIETALDRAHKNSLRDYYDGEAEADRQAELTASLRENAARNFLTAAMTGDCRGLKNQNASNLNDAFQEAFDVGERAEDIPNPPQLLDVLPVLVEAAKSGQQSAIKLLDRLADAFGYLNS